LIDRGATNLNDALYWAGKRGSLDAIVALFEKGATDIQRAIQGAQDGKHKELLDYLYSIMGS